MAPEKEEAVEGLTAQFQWLSNAMASSFSFRFPSSSSSRASSLDSTLAREQIAADFGGLLDFDGDYDTTQMLQPQRSSGSITPPPLEAQARAMHAGIGEEAIIVGMSKSWAARRSGSPMTHDRRTRSFPHRMKKKEYSPTEGRQLLWEGPEREVRWV